MYWTNYPSRLFGQFNNVNRLFEEMSELFENRSFGSSNRSSFPKLNVWANKENAIVTAEVPGVDPGTIQLSIHDSKVTLAGEVPAKKKKEHEVYQRGERFIGKFQRELALPFRVASGKVTGEYINGVLRITLPRADEDKPKTIAVKAA